MPFYGIAPPLDAVAKIKAEMMIVFAENDERINAGWPAYEAALKAAGVRYRRSHYAGTQHGFNNDTTPRYDEAAAQAGVGAHAGAVQPHAARRRLSASLDPMTLRVVPRGGASASGAADAAHHITAPSCHGTNSFWP